METLKVLETETVWGMSGHSKDRMLGGRMQCPGLPSGDPHSDSKMLAVQLQHSQRDSFKDFTRTMPGVRTHQGTSFSRTTFGKISNQGSENMECSESWPTPHMSSMVAAVMTAGALASASLSHPASHIGFGKPA